MKLVVFVVVLAHAGLAQMNCIGQQRPLTPATACLNKELLCICGRDGLNCHWEWTCKGWPPPPAPERTVGRGTTDSADSSPLGGLLRGIIEGRRLRQQSERWRNQQLQKMREKETKKEAAAQRRREKAARQIAREEAAKSKKAAMLQRRVDQF